MLFPKPSLFPKKMGEARVKLKKLYVMTTTNKNHMTDYSGAKLIPLSPKKFNFLYCQNSAQVFLVGIKNSKLGP